MESYSIKVWAYLAVDPFESPVKLRTNANGELLVASGSGSGSGTGSTPPVLDGSFAGDRFAIPYYLTPDGGTVVTTTNSSQAVSLGGGFSVVRIVVETGDAYVRIGSNVTNTNGILIKATDPPQYFACYPFNPISVSVMFGPSNVPVVVRLTPLYTPQDIGPL
jgi:hypothetical protein